MWKPRPNQVMPKEYHTWLIMAGRAFGKTKAAAEGIKQLIVEGKAKRIAFIGQTIKEARLLMAQGISGLFSCEGLPKYSYNKNDQTITFKEYNAIIYLFAGDRPDSLRGFQFDTVWIDELAKFKHPEELYIQVTMTLRISQNPHCIITTTPKPLPLLHRLAKNPRTTLVQGSTFENAENLSPEFIEQMKELYEGTRLGAQEIYGELFEEEEGVLFKRSQIQYAQELPPMKRVLMGLDPATSKEGCETGIVVCGLGHDNKAYVLDDLSGKYSPCEWVSKVKWAHETYQVDRIMVEVNQGGQMIDELFYMHDGMRLPIQEKFAKHSKKTRAEPIVMAYEKGKVFHTKHFKELEAQMLSYKPGRPADRLDALVWCMTDLFYEDRPRIMVL